MRSSCGSSTDLDLLDPRFVDYAKTFVRVLEKAGLRPTLTSVVRPPSVQRCLKERSDTGVSKLPALAVGKSLHQQGLAFDLVVAGSPTYQSRAGALWEAVFGGEWGGHVGDPVHFQMKSLKPGEPQHRNRAFGPNPTREDWEWAFNEPYRGEGSGFYTGPFGFLQGTLASLAKAL